MTKQSGILHLAFCICFAFATNAQAQEVYQPGKEQARSPFVVWPSAEEAAAGEKASAYATPIAWEKEAVEGGTAFRTQVVVPMAWANRQVLLHVGWASSEYEVRLNGERVAWSGSGTTPADFNLTRAAHEGVNRLEILLPDKRANAPLEGYATGGEATLGECYVLSRPTIRIRDLFTHTARVGDHYNAQIGVAVKTDALNAKRAKVYYELLAGGQVVSYGSQEIELGMRGEDTLRFMTRLSDTMLWSAANPRLCTLRLKTQTEGRYTEYTSLTVGFRTIGMRNGLLTVNGEQIALKTVPELGTAISPSRLIEWKEQGYNLIRLPAGGVAPALYDLCDRIGFYVVEQASIDTSSAGLSRKPGGNPSNDPAWRDAFSARILESYHTAQLHPSVVAFSIAADGSANGINLYEGYLLLKSRERERLVTYPGAAGEWNTDALKIVQ